MFSFSLFFILFFLFTVRSQKLLDRLSQNFQELCILVLFEKSGSFKILLTPSRGEKRQKQQKFGQNFMG